MGARRLPRGTTRRNLVRLQRLIWAMIYSGLLTFVLGLYMLDTGADSQLAGSLAIAGGLIAAVGVALIYVRSRLTEIP